MNSRVSSTTHFNGAAALIRQRKNSRQMTELSKKLLIAVRNNIVSLLQVAHFLKNDRTRFSEQSISHLQ